MKYLKRTEFNKIKDRYDTIIGWGTGPILKMNYRTFYFHMDFLIDGTNKTVGQNYKGVEIKKVDSLLEVKGKVLIIIYAIYENEILDQISQFNHGQIDVIIYSLLDIRLSNGCIVPKFNGKGCEDILLISLINQLNLETIKYLEIGVCHPVMRNNTFMLHEQFGNTNGYRGVLAEANPACWSLIEEYRENDILIKFGISPNEDTESLKFYMFPHLLGHSTFSQEIAEKLISEGQAVKELVIPVKTLNRVLEENFEEAPDILALDAEGLDYEILMSWNSKKYPFKIIVSEIMEDIEISIERLMDAQGYRVYAKTLENIIWVNKDYELFV